MPDRPPEPAAEQEPMLPRVETQWVPLVPGARSIPVGITARSGAMMMVAARADPPTPGPRPVATEVEVRAALVSCLEALVPALEPGWSDCTEHPSCRAVQEAAAVLWGGTRRDPVPSPGPEGARTQ